MELDYTIHNITNGYSEELDPINMLLFEYKRGMSHLRDIPFERLTSREDWYYHTAWIKCNIKNSKKRISDIGSQLNNFDEYCKEEYKSYLDRYNIQVNSDTTYSDTQIDLIKKRKEELSKFIKCIMPMDVDIDYKLVSKFDNMRDTLDYEIKCLEEQSASSKEKLSLGPETYETFSSRIKGNLEFSLNYEKERLESEKKNLKRANKLNKEIDKFFDELEKIKERLNYEQ